jgi:hypothetical protein
VDLRKALYEEIYNNENDPDNDLYYVLEVREPLAVLKSRGPLYGKNPCKAAKAFDYPGGALQLELPDTVEKLINDGYLEKLTPAATVDLLGRSHPPYEEPTDLLPDKEKYFRPYSTSLYTLMDEYYTSKKERNEFRKKLGHAPTPAPTKLAAVSMMTHTVHPSPSGTLSSLEGAVAPLSPPGKAAAAPLSPPFSSPTAVKSLASRFNSSITPLPRSAVGVVSP